MSCIILSQKYCGASYMYVAQDIYYVAYIHVYVPCYLYFLGLKSVQFNMHNMKYAELVPITLFFRFVKNNNLL